MSDLEQRLYRLESISAIMALKARYLNACDAKNTEVLLGCFAPGEITIDYGHVGVFTTREAFVEMFQAAGNHPHILDLHQGANPEITLLDNTSAQGRWSFDYRNVDLNNRTLTLASGFYADVYVLLQDQWLIAQSRVTYNSAIHLGYTDNNIVSVFTGSSVAGLVQYAADSSK